MKFTETKIKGVWMIDLEPREDERGFFARSFAKEEFAAHDIDFNVLHVNRSLNKIKGTTRGMHYQLPPKAEDKLVQCLRGKVVDVALDLRGGSETYGQWVSVELSGENRKMILVPKGFAHGIQTLEDDSEIIYFVTEVYSPESERGVRWNDPAFGIDWPIKEPSVISDKDKAWPLVGESEKPIVEL